MRLNTFITVISVATIVFLLTIFSLQTERILEDSFSELSETQSKNLEQLVQIVFASRKEYLSNFSRVIRGDNDLASSFILSTESKDFHTVITRIEKLKIKSGIPVIDIVSLRGKTLFNGLGSFAKNVSLHPKEAAVTSVVPVKDSLLLLCYAPLKLYDETVGILVLGYPLDQNFSEQIGKETKTTVSFSLIGNIKGTESRVPIEQVGKDVLFASIKADSSVVKQTNSIIQRRLFKFGALILVLFIITLFATLDFGVLRHFRSILAQIALAAGQLREGKLEPLALKEHRIKELSQIADAFNQFSSSIESYDQKLRETTEAVSIAKEKAAVAEVVEEVIHDLKAPLSAIDKFIAADQILTKDSKFILGSSLGRILEILGALKKGKNQAADKPKDEGILTYYQPLPELVEQVLKEKRVQYQNKKDLLLSSETDSEPSELSAKVDPATFKRVISNLVDNAVESIETHGIVLVLLTNFQNMVEVRIQDNGKGISKEIIEKLGKKGATFGKPNGSGLGLYTAKKAIDGWKGALRISSTPNLGTTVRIFLPR